MNSAPKGPRRRTISVAGLGAHQSWPGLLGLLERLAWLHPYSNYLHRALISWVFCMIVMITTSLLTIAPPREKTEGIIWTPRYALLPKNLQAIYGGWKDFRIWWLLFVVVVLSIYGFFLWFRFQHPENP